MIFVSIALLVVAAVALGIGIVSSSVPPLVVSILLTLVAAGVLWASFVRYRSEAAAAGATVQGLGGNQARQPGWPNAYADNGRPTEAVATATGAMPPVFAMPVAGPTVDPVPDGWDDLGDDEAAAQVAAFNLEELHGLRRHEVEHAHRDAVLAAVDARIDDLVALRKRLATH